MSDPFDDDDAIEYEYYFPETFEEFTIIMKAPHGKAFEMKDLAASIRSFADGIESGEVPLFGLDEVVTH